MIKAKELKSWKNTTYPVAKKVFFIKRRIGRQSGATKGSQARTVEINVGKSPLNLRITAAAKGTKNGGKRMPRIRKKKVAKKKAKRKKPYDLLGVAGGQKGMLRIGASELKVTRTPDKVILGRMPKKQRLIRE